MQLRDNANLLPCPTTVWTAAALADVKQAVAIVKQCVQKANSVPAPAVLSAMLDLEAAKLPVSKLSAKGVGCRTQALEKE